MSETAIDTAARVVNRELCAADVVSGTLKRIAELDGRLHAFECVLADKAMRTAEQLDAAGDLARLPLAGVPVAVKDNLPVAGAPMRGGTRAGTETPCAYDHPVVERLRAAGAVIVGTTRMPELGIWATTDGGGVVTRNPWDTDRTAGGSSGGSAAAVAAGMVSCAIGNDGLGSLRIPAACCGVFTIKPGLGVVPAGVGSNNWYGFTENGPIASTVRDAALVLSIMAAGSIPAVPEPPSTRLRIALSTRAPMGLAVDPEHVNATRAIASVLERAGHTVEEADP
ncbi:MAG TPA: amidase family protein, partial [Longimicrobiales bacterium]|nr:amidase family protein [Longimicrobiales bacterium]